MAFVNPDGQRDGEGAGPDVPQVVNGGKSLGFVQSQCAEHHFLMNGADLVTEDLAHVVVLPPKLSLERLPRVGRERLRRLRARTAGSIGVISQ